MHVSYPGIVRDTLNLINLFVMRADRFLGQKLAVPVKSEVNGSNVREQHHPLTRNRGREGHHRQMIEVYSESVHSPNLVTTRIPSIISRVRRIVSADLTTTIRVSATT
jgi:hypothetical protein